MSIGLIQPANGSITAPLQKYHWPVHPDAMEITSEDRGLPKAVSFAWEVHSAGTGSVSYDLMISRNPQFDDSLIRKGLSAPPEEVLHLHIATRYFWKIIAKSAGQPLAESPVWSFTTNSATPRWTKVPGMNNVRDMGGWLLPGNRIVRQGVIYRGSEMNGGHQITDEGKRVLVNEFGIRTDLDLRGAPEEVEPVLDRAEVQWINIPVGAYDLLSEESRDGFRKVFQVFAEASHYPILFHCAGGADRTGTVAFLLGALLGNREENLLRDYELTSLSGVECLGSSCWLDQSKNEFRRLLNDLGSFGNDAGNINDSIENYLRSAGVTDEEITAIRTQLIADR